MNQTIIIILLAFTTLGCQTINKEVYTIDKHGLFPVKECGKWGYINSEGKKQIDCQFDKALLFSEGLAGVLVDSVWGFIDTTGKMVIEPKYKRVSAFSDGLCKVNLIKNKKWVEAFIKKDGATAFISPYKHGISSFAYGRATVEVNNEVCVIDTRGKIVFNTHYPYGGGSPLEDGVVQVWGGKGGWVKEGLSQVWRGDTTKYFDKDGTLLLELDGMGYDNFREGLASVRKEDKMCYINKKGETIIALEKPNLVYGEFQEGLAQATIPGRDHTTGFINKQGKVVIPMIYRDVENFSEGLAAFRSDKLWGFINTKGDTVFTPQFRYAKGFKNGLCKVANGKQWGYINRLGKFVWKSSKDIRYKKIDLAKWQLDTLERRVPMRVGRPFGYGYGSRPKAIDFSAKNKTYLMVDTTDITAFADKYLGYKVYLVNSINDTVYVPAQDNQVKLIKQAKNEKGEWQDIVTFTDSFCGHSYHKIQLLPKHYQIYATPITKGSFKTSLRFYLKLKGKVIYSNVYQGTIHKQQFVPAQGTQSTGIAVFAS